VSSATGARQQSDAAPWVVNAAPAGRWPPLRLGQYWTSRELIYFFAWRDVRVRYKQAFLGAAWAVITPVVGAAIFTLVFNELADVESSAPSYFAFALLGASVWTYVSATLQAGAAALVHNADLLTKVWFPRLVLPTAAMLPGLIELAVGMTAALAVTLASGSGISPVDLVVGLPLGTALLLLAVAGPVHFLSAALVKYRDVRALVTVGLQALLFASPVAYPPELVPDRWQVVFHLNPLAGALGLLRSALVHADRPSWVHVGVSAAVAVVLFVAGLAYFRDGERTFADVV
jgi:ABC-type polysaccharide/polyol phosphate export permease